MTRIIPIIVLLLLTAAGVRLMTRPKLKNFTPSEFGIWWPFMSADLLLKLDALRERRGTPIIISSAAGALGRDDNEADTSQHNILRWGEVRAVDFFATVPAENERGWDYIRDPYDRSKLYQDMRAVGFTGIGIYTDTSPGNLAHGDVRQDRTASSPATWARVGGAYTGIAEVIA